MIHFAREKNSQIFAMYTNDEGEVKVLAVCSNGQPEMPSSWCVKAEEKMNSVGRVAFSQALALAYSAVWHSTVLRDLLNNHTEALAIKESV